MAPPKDLPIAKFSPVDVKIGNDQCAGQNSPREANAHVANPYVRLYCDGVTGNWQLARGSGRLVGGHSARHPDLSGAVLRLLLSAMVLLPALSGDCGAGAGDRAAGRGRAACSGRRPCISILLAASGAGTYRRAALDANRRDATGNAQSAATGHQELSGPTRRPRTQEPGGSRHATRPASGGDSHRSTGCDAGRRSKSFGPRGRRPIARLARLASAPPDF